MIPSFFKGMEESMDAAEVSRDPEMGPVGTARKEVDAEMLRQKHSQGLVSQQHRHEPPSTQTGAVREDSAG